MLDPTKDVRLFQGSELIINASSLTIDQKNYGIINIEGGSMPVSNLGLLEASHDVKVNTGGSIALDNSTLNINNDLIIDSGSVTLNNNSTGQAGGDVDVMSSGELNLNNGADFTIGK
jgi:hypothetical protein